MQRIEKQFELYYKIFKFLLLLNVLIHEQAFFYIFVQGGFLFFKVLYSILHNLPRHPSDSTVSEDIEIEPRARICKPFMEPSILAWRNRFTGIDSWAP
jgi:hypothetical protein